MNRIVCTHHKAGSTWIRSAMRGLCDRRGYNWRAESESPAKVNRPVDRGSNVTIISIPGSRYERFTRIATADTRAIRVVRDPRDSLVSQYYSWRNSHRFNGSNILTARKVLRGLTKREGLLWLIDNDQLALARQCKGWPAHDNRVLPLKYEDFLADFVANFVRALEHLALPIDADEVADIRDEFSFETVTGRKRGDERVNRHLRRGVAGDWVNHFDAELSARFDSVYGDLVENLGYERHVEPARISMPSQVDRLPIYRSFGALLRKFNPF